MAHSVLRRLMDAILGTGGDERDLRSAAIQAAADSAAEAERARLLRLRPRIARLFRQDWDALYRDRLRDGR